MPDDRPMLLVSPVVIIVVAQLTEPGSAAQLAIIGVAVARLRGVGTGAAPAVRGVRASV